MNILEILKSRKLIMTILSAVAGIIKVYYPEFPDQALYTIVGSLMGYVLVQGIVDAAGNLGDKDVQKPAGPIDSSELEARVTRLLNRLNEIISEVEQLKKSPQNQVKG